MIAFEKIDLTPNLDQSRKGLSQKKNNNNKKAKQKQNKSKKHKIDLQELNIFKILAFVFAFPVKLKCI